MKSLDGIIRINKKPKIQKENLKFSNKNSVSDPTKRKFLKLAGIAGVGALAYSLIPKQAQGLVFGSSMRTDSVKIKNSSGSEINPATEAKQDEIVGAIGKDKFNIPVYDTQVIDEADPDNITITYKLDGATVAVKTIATSGTTTTISVTL